MKEKVRVCTICGKRFIQSTSGQPKKYCSAECKRIGTNKNTRRVGAERIEQRKAKKGMSGVKVGVLDQRLAEARDRGMSYAELQKEKTLEKIRKGELK